MRGTAATDPEATEEVWVQMHHPIEERVQDAPRCVESYKAQCFDGLVTMFCCFHNISQFSPFPNPISHSSLLTPFSRYLWTLLRCWHVRIVFGFITVVTPAHRYMRKDQQHIFQRRTRLSKLVTNKVALVHIQTCMIAASASPDASILFTHLQRELLWKIRHNGGWAEAARWTAA